MRRLPSIIAALLFTGYAFAQKSPHGEQLAINCSDCHKTDNWQVNSDQMLFKHSSTNFPLEGQHQQIACKSCHANLQFNQTQNECSQCHTDMHQQTVGLACERCHTPYSWMVPNINQIHAMSRFPLLGAHANTDCSQCHTQMVSTSGNSSFLRFDPLSIACYSCHQSDYLATTNPNHAQSNFSTYCTDCHSMTANSWSGAGINHDFFPLVEGHQINNCSECHSSGSFGGLSPDCFQCHQSNYNATSNPNHGNLGFATQCAQCHTLAPGWKPAKYLEHDALSFPIYSGEHTGEWNLCTDCHTNTNNYAEFSCITCHEHNKTEMDSEHRGINGYEYVSAACYACHPNGSGEGGFDHNKSAFPLTGAHTTVNCSDCHLSGYTGTSNVCSSCHLDNFTQTTNPNHSAINLSTDCALCHSTQVDWQPAGFPVHNEFYVLQGAHLTINNDCAACHKGNYTNTANTCFECHQEAYNNSTNPSHQAAQFPITCQDCHSENAWQPTNFNHDGLYFPIYSGKHNNEWNKCSDCHTNASNYAEFSCITCHEHNQSEMDSEHSGINGYSYNSVACLNCHPDGSKDKSLIKNRSNFR